MSATTTVRLNVTDQDGTLLGIVPIDPTVLARGNPADAVAIVDAITAAAGIRPTPQETPR